jgi:DNA end-binding protein Ku
VDRCLSDLASSRLESQTSWEGRSFLALVSCPEALFNARHDRASIKFNQINPDTGNRIKMVTQDSVTGQELERGKLVKGYEFEKNRYLILSDEEFDIVKVESSAVMAVEKFVEATSIDPLYYDASYYLAPDGKAGEDVYVLLRETITGDGKWQAGLAAIVALTNSTGLLSGQVTYQRIRPVNAAGQDQAAEIT